MAPREPTQMGRALQELGIELIPAHSPQAKGRVERLWQTFQDRLVTELLLAGATTLEEADRVLQDFLPRFNSRFGVPARQPGLAYRPLPEGLDPEGVLCFKYPRGVASDNTVQFTGRTLQSPPTLGRASHARARVEVQERLDGTVVVAHRGVVPATTEAPPGPVTLRARGGARASTKRSPDGLVDGARLDADALPRSGHRLGVEPRGGGGHGLGPDREDAPQGTDKPIPPKPSPHHPWRKRLLTESRTILPDIVAAP